MKRLLFILLAVLSIFSAYSADSLTPKREMRSAWVATVWQLDWPQNTVSTTGNTKDIDKQKKDMITLLDSMAVNNMNAINFQVRNRADALYKSSYEPWSSDLVAKRGLDPGYDPLQFVVEESHKRGLECHAWLNPYRYESVIGQWSGLPGDYRKDHPDWIMDNGNASIFNPGKPEVIKLIVDICREIVTNYDIDGVLFDDYFYLGGTPLSVDADLYNEYVAAGGALSQQDWRRDNVNRMIKAVYDMIQEVKPWVRFGVSPAGVAATSKTVADKYGVPPCPSGSDWQYNDIYSDPLAWISQRSLDFISPQIYWTIGYATADYSKIAPWWANVAAKFGRHFYSSHSISSLTGSSKTPEATESYSPEGVSSLEKILFASGPNNTTFKEYADEIKINRESALDDAPGSIFYSCKYLYRTAPLFAHYLKKTVFTRPALLPAMTYKGGNTPGNISDLSLNNGTLTWKGYNNVRYTIYAVPSNIAQKDFQHNVEYLIATSYATSYNIPTEFNKTGYQYAVCVLDRFGNEYSPIFYGANITTLPAAELITPTQESTAIDPFNFEWKSVANATSYILEVAKDAAFTEIVATILTKETSVSSASLETLTSDVPHFWRVRSCATNYNDGISATIKFTPRVLSITSPANMDTDVSLTPTIKWVSDNTSRSILEIATDANFPEGSIIYSGESTKGELQIPAFTLLGYTRYFARVKVTSGDTEHMTPVISFMTEVAVPAIPTVKYPIEGGKLYSEDMITLERQPEVATFRVFVSESTSFGRYAYNETLKNFSFQSAKGSAIKISSKYLEEGKTYYLKALATYSTPEGNLNTGYCDIISFTYAGTGSGVEDNIANSSIKILGGETPMLHIAAPSASSIAVYAISTTGVTEKCLYNGLSDSQIEISLNDLEKGIHLIQVKINGTTKTLKFIR